MFVTPKGIYTVHAELEVKRLQEIGSLELKGRPLHFGKYGITLIILSMLIGGRDTDGVNHLSQNIFPQKLISQDTKKNIKVFEQKVRVGSGDIKSKNFKHVNNSINISAV